MHTRSAYKLKFGTFRAHFSYFDDCQEYNSSYNFMLVGLINIITFPCNGNIAVIVRPFGNDDPIDSIQNFNSKLPTGFVLQQRLRLKTDWKGNVPGTQVILLSLF